MPMWHLHLILQPLRAGPQSTGTLPSAQASQDMSRWPEFPVGQGGPLSPLHALYTQALWSGSQQGQRL